MQALVLEPMAALPASPVEGQMARLVVDGQVYTFIGGLWVQGVGPPTGGSVTYVHHQIVPNAVWTITHPLGHRPVVSIVDATGEPVIADVRYPALNIVQITFLVALDGYAYLV